MNEREDEGALERLERASREIEESATEVAVRGAAFGPDIGARNRIAVVKQRLKVALDELQSYPQTTDEITDE